ncbi:hypothetical protein B4U79_16968 [Dinothrombium tinctorium]|uniref:CCHC-type domain-containing protein n=2 Tax=Dinothrombium tinctorium TaxID=1965070 RepID=A0A443Q9W1_9ACAR|nr:hypothetical protein B4U79_16968 [Dinothrombium tinctorium]
MYRVLDLCMQVNPNMPERDQLRYILAGLKGRYREQLATSGENRNLHDCKNALRRLGAATQQYFMEEENYERRQLNNASRAPIKNNERTKPTDNGNANLVCFNCEGKHFLRNCPQPKDQARIEANRQMLRNLRQDRYKNVRHESTVNAIQGESNLPRDIEWMSWNPPELMFTGLPEKQEGDDHQALINTLQHMSVESLPKDEPKLNCVGEEMLDNLRNGKLPYVEVEINGVKTKGVIDSGSVISVISVELFQKVNAPIFPWKLGNFKLADG